MLQSALVIVAAGSAVAQTTYPDQLDVLRAADTTPQIELVLDTSGSMAFSSGIQNTTCSWYYNNETEYDPDPNYPLLRIEMLKAVLLGCETESDGLLDRWGNDVIFAIREFGGTRTLLRADFFGGPTDAEGIPVGTNIAGAKAAVELLEASGGTPLARAYGLAARHFGEVFNDSNSRHCRQNFITLMTDGVGNQNYQDNPVPFDFIPANSSLNVSDTQYCYPTGCGSVIAPPFSDQAAAYLVRDSSGDIVDALPLLSDTELPDGSTRGQPIRTYTIAFEPDATSAEFLRDMALAGEGEPFTATSYEQLDTAFESIISNIIPRSQVAFSPGTVQNDGLFSGNYMYRATFQPAENSHWFGTVKKHCVIPTGPSDTTCLFLENAAGELIGNPSVVDQWTGTNVPETTVGGTGQRILEALGAPSVPSNPYSQRNLLTWRSGTTGYFPVDDSPSFTTVDTRTNSQCDHFRLINKLHGYTDQVADCAAGNYAPVGFDTAAQADTANGFTALLRYTPECESSSSQCYVLTNTNNGILHVFETRDGSGSELSAVIPGELWHSQNVANNQLSEIMDQPNLEEMKRYYFDGGGGVFHEDRNGNGYIDNSEVAYLVAGLGRGGRAYYLWDMSAFNGDFGSASAPQPRPLMVDEATGFRNLRDTWATPWLGLLREGGGAIRRVAAFPSGHMRELDHPDAAFGEFEAAEPSVPTDSEAAPYVQSCADLGVDPALCSPPFSTPCIACDFPDPVAGGCPEAVPPQTYCYDSPANNGDPTKAPFNNNPGDGYNLLFGPFTWSSGSQVAEAYRITFSTFQLQAGDFIEVLDGQQRVVATLSESGTGSVSPCGGAACTGWIYTDTIYFRFVTDGADTEPVTGWTVGNVELIRRNATPAARPAGSGLPSASDYTRPTFYIVDLDQWAALPAFASRPTGADTRQRAAIYARFAADCDGLGGGGEICVDATSQPDLRHMKCPLSAAPAVYQEGGVFRAAFVGDECGNLFKIAQDPGGAWTVNRILRLNNADGAGNLISNGRSEDYRKIFTQPELVLSRCNGGRSIGVYFATGNIQLPSSETTLRDASITRDTGTGFGTYDGDVFGVVWDSNLLARPADGLGLGELFRLNGGIIEVTNPAGGLAVNGWYLELGTPGAKVLRDPVVFDGVANFKVYAPDEAPTECVSGNGLDAVYAMNNCNAAPIADGFDPGDTVGDNAADRIVWRGSTDIGSGLLVFTPPDGDAFVSPVDTAGGEARLPGRDVQRGMRVFLWRTFVDE